MPRASSATKRLHGAANNRDTRHENGLVGPGKRVQKQKSNGQLNGHAKSSESPSSTPPLPGTPQPSNGHARVPTTADITADPKMPLQHVRRPSVTGYDESSSSESYPAIALSQENHRRIDVNAVKNPAVHRDGGPLNLVLTVLRSCPLYDTIAILIVLLQLPPTFLSIVHLLFATLTFVPPSTTATSGLSFTDIFEGTLGTPSLATIVVVDMVVLLVWLFLWGPLQDIALDLAQSVIALTLGGGTSGNQGGMNNVLVCFAIIGISHFTRGGNIKHTGLRSFLASSPQKLFGSPDPDDPLEPIAHGGGKKGPHGWIRSILAIHILTQGVVRYIRDWYVRREKRDISASNIGDPEAAKGLADSNNDSTPHTSTPECEPSTALSVPSTVVTSKKKRKQSAQVRIRQPLWAALASTKIVMVKEYETSHTAAESAGTNATDINNLGNAPFNTEADRIWITYVGSDEVFFSTSFFPSHTAPENGEKKKLDLSGIDRSKPFYVRVNKTVWQPTRINATTDSEQSGEQDTRWSGEIFGLAPMSSYECDFVSTLDDTPIFSTSVRTLQAPADIATSGLSPNPQVSFRSSPTTTLKTSIATSEVKLNEERNRLKRQGKDQKAKISSARREIDKLAASIASSGGNDDRLRQKIQQSNLHMRQAEEALISVASHIEALAIIPADDTAEHKSTKETYQSQKETHKQSRSDFSSAKAAAERDIQSLSNEIAALEQKRERMQSRVTKLNGEHERITDANARGLDEAQRKEKERTANDAERAKMEMLYLERLHSITADIGDTTANLQILHATIDSLQQAELYAAQQQQSSPTNSIPTMGYGEIPEGSVGSNYPWNPPSSGPWYGNSSMLASQGPRTRGRSSSMLSNVSGFTQSSGDGAEPVQSHVQHSSWGSGNGNGSAGAIWAYPLEEKDRQGSSGSGEGDGGSAGGSERDPKSPITGNGNGNGKVVRW